MMNIGVLESSSGPTRTDTFRFQSAVLPVITTEDNRYSADPQLTYPKFFVGQVGFEPTMHKCNGFTDR